MVNGFWYYRALESVSIASALSTALTIYPCQIRVHQSKLQLPTARKKEWRPATADSSPHAVTCQHCDTHYFSRPQTRNLPIIGWLLVRRATSSATDIGWIFLWNSLESCVCVSRRVGRRQRVRSWPVCVCWTSIIEDEASTSPSVRFTSTHSTPPTTPNECTTNWLWRPLTGTAMKHSVPDQVKLSFVIFDSPERQSAQMSKIIQITA